ncbi:hypothetical protein E3P81_03214 [Wallemia ichthyophaga]|nr:hypothetical protein E3P98_02943 [Wallemia ichthyophaga]TIA88986.1 hypothetical protein E3P97_03294 [Wallemia ichthyophaga]TIA96621.1 hypothetical protein E3P96_03570 [Wallemia ichthyophaga]TIA97829.1 hypothetical protein E3P94_03177 [Wallemia ichthyophaga]TIA98532.1 hypothetical protein E3P95_02433 [Wallemia ichthyophaga]
MRSILNRIMKISNIEICIFGDKVILDEDVENWPLCDYLVSFFSDGFPLDKAIDYVNLRKPVCINDLTMQKLLWDRRLVLSILDSIGVVTAERISVDRDGGPNIDPQLAEALQKDLGLSFPKNPHQPVVKLREDGDAIIIDGIELEKPFVEKPVNGEDHNIHIYFPMSQGGGARKLFRKVGNKSSEYYPEIQEPRYEGSFIYEKFINVDNAEDVKVYTVGPSFVHAETRKSPVVDGIVRRNTDGKEIRYITELTADEKKCATNICKAFKQNICGFDLLRYDDKAFVIDVNGWSFVKGNDYYYDKCAEILSTFCRKTAPKRPLTAVHNGSPRDKGSWKLKANATVVRHADRTPKQKIKFSFQASEKWAQPFIRLLRGATEEVILRRAEQLNYITEAADEAVKLGCNELEKLEQLRIVISKKIGLPGTKAQLKPNFNKNDGITLEKLALVFKWGGEFTHAARYQSRDLGFSFRGDAMIMNKDMLENCKIYSSSERRVLASAEIFAAAFLEDPEKRKEGKEPITHPLIVRKDLLDDSNAGKELMDFVKKKLKTLLRPGEKEKRPQFQWPKDLKGEPVEVVAEIIELMRYHRDVMRSNFETLDVDNIQTRWCCNEHPLLFKERWEKLFSDFCESTTQEKFDPSRISELYDSLKYDSLHNSIFLNTIFRPNGQQDPSDRRLHSLYGHAKALFDLIAPQEYGIEPEEKEKIGILTSLPLLKKIVNDLQEARDAEKGSFSIYFTKESHIHTLVQLVLCSGLPITMPHVPELDYVAHLTLELYERSIGSAHREKEYSIRLALSGGAHTSNVLDSQLDAKHSLNVQPRRQLTHHLDYDYAIQMLSRHFDKDWVFSTTPLEGDALYGIKPDHIEQIREVRLNGGATMSGNQALEQHPFDFVDIHLTKPGSSFQWAVYSFFGASGIAALFLVYFSKRYVRGLWALAFVIFHISFITYYLLASGLGWVAIEAQWPRDDSLEFGGTRQINYPRFVQQILVSPVYLLVLLLGTGANVEIILFGMFTQIYFWVCMLLAALISDQYKWGLFTMGVVLEFNVWAVLLYQGTQALGSRGNIVQTGTYYAAAGWYLIIYLLYIIAAGVSELGNVITVTAEAVFYGVLDLCIQVVLMFVYIPIFASYVPGVGSRGAALEGQELGNQGVSQPYTLPRKEVPSATPTTGIQAQSQSQQYQPPPSQIPQPQQYQQTQPLPPQQEAQQEKVTMPT